MARRRGIASLSQFAKRLAAYAQGIIASATCRLNTRLLEGINHRIKAIKRMAWGYRDNDGFCLKIRDVFSGNAR